jgi:hypothetical protein
MAHGWSSGVDGYLGALHTWRYMSAYDIDWPAFDSKYVNCRQSKKKWLACRRKYHRMAGDTLIAKSIKDKCVSAEVKIKIGNTEDLFKI